MVVDEKHQALRDDVLTEIQIQIRIQKFFFSIILGVIMRHVGLKTCLIKTSSQVSHLENVIPPDIQIRIRIQPSVDELQSCDVSLDEVKT